MTKRIFMFGCSYTQYQWPTWADILKDDQDIETYNYGRSGLGNVGIMHEIVRADLKHTFTDNDIISVVWTDWTREDRIFKGDWTAHGNVFNHPIFDKKFTKKYWNLTNDIIKNNTAMISINKMYSNILKFQGFMEHPYEHLSDNFGGMTDDEKAELDFYTAHIRIQNVFKNEDPYTHDGHPSVKEHLEYYIEHVAPELNLSVNKKTIRRYKKLDAVLRKISVSNLSRDKKSDQIIKQVTQLERTRNEAD